MYIEHGVGRVLVPSAQEVAEAPRLRIFGESDGLLGVTETSAYGVQMQLAAYSHVYRFISNGQTHYSTRNITGSGIALSSSYDDFSFVIRNVCGGVMEAKGTDDSVLRGFHQAAVTATNIAMTLLDRGYPREDIVIPVVGTDGFSMIFGVTILLEDTFPTLIPLSKFLDLSDPSERNIASAYLLKASHHVQKMLEFARNDSMINEMSLVDEPNGPYYLKALTATTLSRGLGLYNSQDWNYFQPGLNHMIECLNLIYADVNARAVAEYPLSIRTPDSEESSECYYLVFRNLTSLGYSIGAPNRAADPALFEKFRMAYSDAVRRVHAAGVIHGDLYLSNVMWKVEPDESVSIIIIDWDTAHCLAEGKFVDAIERKLKAYLRRHYSGFGTQHDMLYVNALLVPRDSVSDAVWEALASRNVDEVNNAFREILNVSLSVA